MTIVLNDDDPDASLLVRTDFSDDEAWKTLVAKATAPQGPDQFSAGFVPISDPALDGMGPAEIAALEGSAFVVFVADAASMTAPEPSLVVVDRDEEPGRSFRVVVPEAWGPENNLRLANMDFVDYAEAAGPDGVFRGFAH